MDAAIAENAAMRSKEEREAAQKSQAALLHPVVQAALGHTALSHQEVVEKLDVVPAFHLVATEGKKGEVRDDPHAVVVRIRLL